MIFTPWHLKLSVLEKYITLKPYLKRVLPRTAPNLLDDCTENCAAEWVDILREVRRVARALEADRRVTASRVPRLLRELVDTLRLLWAGRATREEVLNSITPPRTSIYADDLDTAKARTRTIRDEDARMLAGKLAVVYFGAYRLFMSACEPR